MQGLLQARLDAMWFPSTAIGLHLRSGVGYFRAKGCFDCDGNDLTDHGYLFAMGMGWCWSIGLCLSVNYSPLISVQGERWHESWIESIDETRILWHLVAVMLSWHLGIFNSWP